MSFLVALTDAVRHGDIPLPPGMDPDSFVQRLSEVPPESWGWVLNALVRNQALDKSRKDLDEALIGALLAVQDIRPRVKALDDMVRPLFQPADDPHNEGVVEWRNLWAFWQFVPGTIKPRVLLTLWELSNWVVASLVGYWLGGFGWLAWIGGTWVLVGLLFIKHELLFRWYGRTVCGVPEREHGPGPGFNSCLERWNGPTY